MDTQAVLDEFRAAGALLEGHFILSSGLRSPVFLQKAKVFADAARTGKLCAALADKVRAELDVSPDIIVSPAVGGIVPGYEMGRQMGLPAIYVEREEGAFRLRRGFELSPGQKVLVVEDIVTTGLSSRECIDSIRETGAEVLAEACLIDRSGGKADVGVPLIALATVEFPAYAADDLPPELAAQPAVKPGSRGLAQ
ncbi:orotate phosphoribosyltransferase [Hyphobacterium sp.]|jgi:orotate phosphoribosyltransferase|uniref:orotate phosphoribosyltransferase n=1 Tax=Hyphobacterium sp. TaxID=2004662 RepID=UPI003BAAB280